MAKKEGLKKILKWIRQYILRVIPDKTFIQIVYRVKIGRKLDLKNPKTFNEKLQWLKLYNRKPEYTKMADKYEVREYVKKSIGEEYLIPLVGVYNSFNDINFNSLPKKFVIKCNHDSGSTIICKDKNKLDMKEIKKMINRSLRYNYYYTGREYQYKNISRKIIIEEYLEEEDGDIKDYKYFIFNGKFSHVLICSERSRDVKFTFFDKNGNFLDIRQGNSNNDKNIKLPKEHKKMIELAEKLAKNTIQLRVDFYVINGKIYFGELTFFDSSGFDKFEPEYWDKTIGSWLHLPIEEKYNEKE